MVDYDASLADIARTLVLMVGFALAMVCVKFGVLAWRNGEGYRAWGLVSYGCLVLTPSILGLYRYGEPVLVVPTVIYSIGMICGVVALGQAYTVRSDWARLRRSDSARRAKARA